jgi:hypothetical protein
MKEGVILRFLAQESSKSKLQLRRYGQKSYRDLFEISRKWIGVYLELFLKTRDLLGIFVDCSLITKKGKGLAAKSVGIFWFQIYFPMENCHGLGPWLMNRGWCWSTVDTEQRRRWWLTGAPSPDRYRPRRLIARWGKRRRAHRGSVPTFTRACMAVRRRHDGGGASAQDGDGAGVMRTRRRRVGGVGIFIGGKVTFYRAEARRRRAGVPSWSTLKGLQ